MATIASPTYEDACTYLQAEHNITVTPKKLEGLVRAKPEQYEELRERVAPLKEQALVHNMLDNALYASDVTRLAMEQLVERLQAGRIKPEYLSRVARDIADVQTKAIDKQLTLEGRPTQISETRTAPEVIGALERLGVVKQIDVAVDG